MKRIVFFLLMACLICACQSNVVNNNPQIVLQNGLCGDVFDLAPVKANMPALTHDSIEDPFAHYGRNGVECAWMGENQLRLVHHVWANCCEVKVKGSASIKDNVITLKSSVSGLGVCDCICDYPICSDVTQLEYGTYTVKAGDIEFTIDFQPNMGVVKEWEK